MAIDILILVLCILLLVYGFTKGIVLAIVNLLFVVFYLNISDMLLGSVLKLLNNPELASTINNSLLVKYIVVAIVGIVISVFINKILKKFLKITKLSILDKIIGLVVYGVIAYLLICVANIIIVGTDSILHHTFAQESFFLSDKFNEYNLIRMWFNG